MEGLLGVGVYSDSDEEHDEEINAKFANAFALVHYDHDDEDQDKQDSPNSQADSGAGGKIVLHKTPPPSPKPTLKESDVPNGAILSSKEDTPGFSEGEDNSTKDNIVIDEVTKSTSPAVVEKDDIRKLKMASGPSLDELLPPKPTQECDPALKERLAKFHNLKAEGRSVTKNLQTMKEFNNPDIVEKLVLFYNIDEIASNYPKELFDPSALNSTDFYDTLAIEQQQMFEKRESEKRTQIDFTKAKSVSETTTSTAPAIISITNNDPKRKSKWDMQGPSEGKPEIKAEVKTEIVAPPTKKSKKDKKDKKVEKKP